MKYLFSCFIFLFFCGLSASDSYSQDYLGIANSAFAGVNGIDVNPASIVINPRKWDVTIIGVNFALANNYIGLQQRVFSNSSAASKDNNFANDYLTKRSSGASASVFLGMNLMLPSFMFTRPKHKDAFAFSCRSRVYLNVDGVDPNLAHMLIEGQNDSSLFQQNFNALKISVQAMVWNEYGIIYGRTVKETSNERLNVAGRIKLIQGLYSAYLFVNNLDYKFNTKDSVLLLSSLIHYGHSTNLEFNPNAAKFAFGGKPSVGLDLGATYEFHKLTNVRSKISSQSNTTPLQHEYRYKVGLSVQDLGWITYLKPPDARDFVASVQQPMNFSSLSTSGTTPLAGADDSLKLKFAMNANDTKYRMTLPTLVSAQGDYYAGKNIYVNSTFNYAFQFKNRESKIHEVTTLSLTPRWDWKWIGAYFPVSYNKYSHVRAGFSLRLGPLIIGTADLLPLLLKKDLYGVDFHFMLKVPHIHFKKHASNPHNKSRFDVNREKPNKPRKGKSDMPKKDNSTYEQSHEQPKPEKKKKNESSSPTVKQEKHPRKHIFPKIHLFKKKRSISNPHKGEHTIYFKL